MPQTVKNPTGGEASGGSSGLASKRPAVDHPDATSKSQRLGGGGPPPPPKLPAAPSALPPPKISLSFGAKKTTLVAASAPKPPVKAISMKLGSRPQSGGPAPAAALKPKSMLAARAFGDDDSDDEDEEMPPEAKMRMKNIGRETPTSAGPNSFGKTKIGFCDSKKKRELDQEETLAE